MQILMLTGVLGRNAEVKKIDTAKVISFSVACKIGDQTTWYECSYWRNADDECKVAQYLVKGCKVAVTGRPSASAYKSKDGEAKASLNVNVNQVELVSSPAQEDPF